MNEPWRRSAVCTHPSVRPEDFSPVDSRGRVDLTAAVRIAERACRVCPVRAECVADAAARYATDNNPPLDLVQGGVWWPAAKATDPNPINLLTDQRQETAA